MEIFSSFCIKAFNWIYELFDNKIVPDVPTNKPNNPFSQYTGWNMRPMSQNNYLEVAESAKSWYSSPSYQTSNDSWYYNWKTWLIIGGSIIAIGALYTGYIYISDWLSPNGNQAPQVRLDNRPQPNNSNGWMKTIGDVLVFNRINNITNGLSYVKEKIIPSMDATEFNAVNRNPQNPQNFENYYPYTYYDPTQPWYERLRLKIMGESSEEYRVRTAEYLAMQEESIKGLPKVKNMTLPDGVNAPEWTKA